MLPTRQKRSAAILGAGLGTRLKDLSFAKPLLSLNGRTLVERMILQLAQQGFERIIVVLREELLSAADLAALPHPKGVEYLLVNTPSSLHTLAVAITAHQSQDKEPLFVTMVDTIIQTQDLADFTMYCSLLPQDSSALLGTLFIDDENPLYIEVDQREQALSVGSKPSKVVTAGMYFLSVSAQNIAAQAVTNGIQKMRNFLSALVEQGEPVQVFTVEKTLDLDRPEDLTQAEQFI
jgi:NDP-sugar pyrophosphorylase family protein